MLIYSALANNLSATAVQLAVYLAVMRRARCGCATRTESINVIAPCQGNRLQETWWWQRHGKPSTHLSLPILSRRFNQRSTIRYYPRGHHHHSHPGTMPLPQLSCTKTFGHMTLMIWAMAMMQDGKAWKSVSKTPLFCSILKCLDAGAHRRN